MLRCRAAAAVAWACGAARGPRETALLPQLTNGGRQAAVEHVRALEPSLAPARDPYRTEGPAFRQDLGAVEHGGAGAAGPHRVVFASPERLRRRPG